MSGFQLPSNFVEDPEQLLRRTRRRQVPPQRFISNLNPLEEGVSAPVIKEAMAQKTISEYSAPSADNVATGPQLNLGDATFELKPALINMVQANPFCGKPHEDANAHLQHFLEVCGTFTIKNVAADAIRLCLFPFSLLGKAKQWFYANKGEVTTWERCANAFLKKFFPMGKTSALRGKISSFQQQADETIPEAWERLQEYIRACPHHGIEEWLLIQGFYHGLTGLARSHLDAAAGGAFLQHNVKDAKDLIEKMVINQGWNEERLQPKRRGVHALNEVDMLSAKMDLLMKKMEESSKQETIQPYATARAIESDSWCEVCGGDDHSGNNCPETKEEVSFINNNNNGYRPQQQQWNSRPFYQGNQGNGYNQNFNNSFGNQPSLRDLVLGQSKINDSINKKMMANDKILENLSEKLDSFNSAMKNQLSFNKMLETQLAQLAAAVPSFEQGKIPGKPEDPIEGVKLVTTRFGKPPVQSNWSYLLDSPFITKKDDPGLPTITCEIGPQIFHNAFCDLGSGVNIMAKVTYDNLLGGPLHPTFVRLQMADQTIRFPEGLARDILVKVQDDYVPADFIILDMGSNNDVSIILGRPFLNTVNAVIYVGSGQIHLQFPGWKVKCPFNGYKANMQVKDKEPPTKPRHIRRRRDKRGKSAKRAEKKEEEPAEPKINTKQVWREKEVQSRSTSPGPSDAPEG
jgi:hypothetical protein